VHIEEFAPHMRPAGGFDDLAAGKRLIEAGVAVGMDDASELLEMLARVLALAIR
jgi:hypothetical protein